MNEPAKLPYTKPVLIRYGNIVEMTTGGSVGNAEGAPGMCTGSKNKVCLP